MQRDDVARRLEVSRPSVGCEQQIDAAGSRRKRAERRAASIFARGQAARDRQAAGRGIAPERDQRPVKVDVAREDVHVALVGREHGAIDTRQPATQRRAVALRSRRQAPRRGGALSEQARGGDGGERDTGGDGGQERHGGSILRPTRTADPEG
jgi:hypothetical protein